MMVGEGLILLAVHLVADFPLQTDEMASKKLDDVLVRFDHVTIHMSLMVLTLLFIGKFSAIFVLLYGAAHFVIDSRRWADEKEEIPGWPIIIDQTLHIAVLAVLAVSLL